MKMNIVFNCNKPYIRYLYITLSSLLEHNDEEMDVYILHNGLEKISEDIILQLSNERVRIYFHYVSEKLFEQAPTDGRILSVTYYRLLIPWILPQTEKKALYLDVDIIVNQDLRKFYDLNLDDYVLAACQVYDHLDILAEGRKGFENFRSDHKYFCAAVLLCNLANWRKKCTLEDYGKVIHELGDALRYHDQDILNLLFAENTLFVPTEKYCYQPCHNGQFPFMRNYYDKLYDYNMMKEEVAIIHYAGYSPWRAGIPSEHYELWWEYAEKSPFYSEILAELIDFNGYEDVCDAEYILHTKLSPYKGSRKAGEYMRKKGCKKISLYGAGDMAGLLIKDLGEYKSVIRYIFDMSGDYTLFHGITVCPADDLSDKAKETEVIINTLWYYPGVLQYIRANTDIPVISILDVWASKES